MKKILIVIPLFFLLLTGCSQPISENDALNIIEQQENYLENAEHEKLLALLPKEYLSEAQNTVFFKNDDTANVFFSSYDYDQLEYELKEGTISFDKNVKKTINNIEFQYDSDKGHGILKREITYKTDKDSTSVINDAVEVYTFKLINDEVKLIHTKSENVIRVQ